MRRSARNLSTRPGAPSWLDSTFPLKKTWTNYTPHSLTPASASLNELPVRGPVESPIDSRALRVCLIGPTNAGKSTLLNMLINSPVSIVSDKIHTTRENTLGYLTDEQARTQIEFIDAPGSLGPSVPVLRRAIWDAVRASDLAFVVVDAAELAKSGPARSRLRKQLRGFLEQVRKSFPFRLA